SIVKKPADRASEAGTLPVPPTDLWEGWGGTVEDYLASGRADMEAMRRVLVDAGARPHEFARVLDFGCASGRMMRFLPVRAEHSEIWGVDIKARHIVWC